MACQANMRTSIGSGTSNLLFYLSSKYNINCLGIEVSPILYLYSKIKSLFYEKVKIKYGNLFKYDLSEADVIYAFLCPKLHNKLKDKVNAELKKGSKVVLSSWPFKGLEPIQVSRKKGGITYYLYKM